MLSLTACVLPNTSLIQQPSPFNIQPPLSFTKHKRTSRTGNNNNYSNSHCFSCKSTSDSTSASCFEYPETTTSPGYKGTPGLHFSKTESASEFVDSGELLEARKVFDAMPERNVVSWTAMINGYFKFGLDDEALSYFSQAIKDGIGNWRNLIVDSAVVYFYVQCGDLKSAFCVFDRMVERDVVSWTTMITACSQQGRCGEAFGMFTQMLNGGFLPNGFTASGVLKACGEEKGVEAWETNTWGYSEEDV
ncbi:hypothetical protein OIU84_005735 [Salix udensis]|uniref:Pentatricopeptide repeat-containing protein n=1 Tax=Salix udensis TaxID=889485 RepID=A0AAD6JWV3_9ROSI|nr:hypothetical protein OIU84_005735 [Salix udensis]